MISYQNFSRNSFSEIKKVMNIIKEELLAWEEIWELDNDTYQNRD